MKTRFIVSCLLLTVATAAFYFGKRVGLQERTPIQNSSQSSGGNSGLLSLEPETEREPKPGELNQTVDTGTLPAWFNSGIELTSREMEEAARAVLEKKEPLTRELLFPQLLARLTPDNAWGMWDTLRSLDQGQDTIPKVILFAQVWGKIDGKSAMSSRSKSEAWGAMLGSFALESWARQSPGEALEWAQEERRSMSKPFNEALLSGLADSAPDKASGYLISLADSADPASYVAPLVTAKMEEGLEETESWIEELTLPALKSSGLTQLAKILVEEDPAQACKWIEKHMHDSSSSQAVGIIADALLQQSFRSADDHQFLLDWLHALPAGSSRNAAHASAARSWAKRDANAVGRFLSDLEPSEARDHAVRAFALEITRKDPESAVHWANTISDTKERERTLYATARHWFRSSPAESQQWLDQADLEPSLRRRIIEGSHVRP